MTLALELWLPLALILQCCNANHLILLSCMQLGLCSRFYSALTCEIFREGFQLQKDGISVEHFQTHIVLPEYARFFNKLCVVHVRGIAL